MQYFDKKILQYGGTEIAITREPLLQLEVSNLGTNYNK